MTKSNGLSGHKSKRLKSDKPARIFPLQGLLWEFAEDYDRQLFNLLYQLSIFYRQARTSEIALAVYGEQLCCGGTVDEMLDQCFMDIRERVDNSELLKRAIRLAAKRRRNSQSDFLGILERTLGSSNSDGSDRARWESFTP